MSLPKGMRIVARADVPRVVKLFRQVLLADPAVPDDRLEAYFLKIYFDHPWFDPDLPGYVYEGKDGELLGFIGTTPRIMTFEGRRIRAAISSNFMVDPTQRGSLAGVLLLKAVFEGRQDLTIAEGNDASRVLWMKLGGGLSILQSLHWMSLLRPATYLVRRRARAGTWGGPWAPAMVAARGIDVLADRFRGTPLRRAPEAGTASDLDVATFVAAVDEAAHGRRLRPVYDASDAGWLFDLLRRKTRFGEFRSRAVRDPAGALLGWYLWYRARNDVGHVVQIEGKTDSVPAVLSHLFHEAWADGAAALTGRLDIETAFPLADRVAALARRHTWMLIQSRDPGILQAIKGGDAFFTRLEGEWWIPYHEGSPR